MYSTKHEKKFRISTVRYVQSVLAKPRIIMLIRAMLLFIRSVKTSITQEECLATPLNWLQIYMYRLYTRLGLLPSTVNKEERKALMAPHLKPKISRLQSCMV